MEEGDGFTNSEVDIFDFIAHETPALYDYIRENVESIHSKFGIIPDEQLPKLIEEFKAYYEKFTLSDEPLPHFAAQSMGWTPLKYNTIRLLLEHIKQNSKIENSRKRASYFLNKLEYGRVFSQNDEQILSIITLKAHKLFKNLSEYCEQYYPDSFLNDSEIEKIIKASKTQSESSSTSEGSHCETVSTEPKSGTPKVG